MPHRVGNGNDRNTIFRPPEMTDGCKEAYPVPKELWFLCDLLTSLGLDQEHLFSHHGLKHEILQGESQQIMIKFHY